MRNADTHHMNFTIIYWLLKPKDNIPSIFKMYLIDYTFFYISHYPDIVCRIFENI